MSSWSDDDMIPTTVTGDAPGLMRESLRAHLHRAVHRQRRLRTARRIGLGGLTCGVLALGLIWLSDSLLPGAADIQIIATESTGEPRLQRIPTTAQVRYVAQQQPGLTRVPTRRVPIAILSDTELLDTFSEQAYAVLPDEDEGIQSFYLLAEMTVPP